MNTEQLKALLFKLRDVHQGGSTYIIDQIVATFEARKAETEAYKNIIRVCDASIRQHLMWASHGEATATDLAWSVDGLMKAMAEVNRLVGIAATVDASVADARNSDSELVQVRSDLVEANATITKLREAAKANGGEFYFDTINKHGAQLREKDQRIDRLKGLCQDNARTILGLRDTLTERQKTLDAMARSRVENHDTINKLDRSLHEANRIIEQLTEKAGEHGKKIHQLQGIIRRQRLANNNLRAQARDNNHKTDYDKACQTIALMHEAATGRKGEAPIRGVVEDCADVRAELLKTQRVKVGALHDMARIVFAIRAARDMGVSLTAELFEIANASGGEAARTGIEERLVFLREKRALADVEEDIANAKAKYRADSPPYWQLNNIENMILEARERAERELRPTPRPSEPGRVTAQTGLPDLTSAMHDVLASNGAVSDRLHPSSDDVTVKWSQPATPPEAKTCKACVLERGGMGTIFYALHTCQKHAAPAAKVRWTWFVGPDGSIALCQNGKVVTSNETEVAARIVKLLNRHGLAEDRA